METTYTYAAIIDWGEEGFINISFPDFENASTCVLVGEDYVEEAQNYLSLIIMDYEDSNQALPQCNLDINTPDEAHKLLFVNVWMPYYRSKIKEVYVKKTLTIPQWLDILAKNNHVNFSAVLSKGLKQELGLTK